MPAAIDWSHRDALLVWLRHERTGWDEIARRLGLPVSTCMDRARAIGARPPVVLTLLEEDVNRPPLPPGHPTTWGLLTRGTILEGSPYH
jgi:hypothetical protein